MGKTTLNTALKNIKFEFTIHDLRETSSMITNKNSFNTDWVELQLAHVSINKIRASYPHVQSLNNCRTMMQWWADHVDS